MPLISAPSAHLSSVLQTTNPKHGNHNMCHDAKFSGLSLLFDAHKSANLCPYNFGHRIPKVLNIILLTILEVDKHVTSMQLNPGS